MPLAVLSGYVNLLATAEFGPVNPWQDAVLKARSDNLARQRRFTNEFLRIAPSGQPSLAIGERVTEVRDGKIWMKGELGNGSKVNMVLPYCSQKPVKK
jgi:hypothetical protein